MEPANEPRSPIDGDDELVPNDVIQSRNMSDSRDNDSDKAHGLAETMASWRWKQIFWNIGILSIFTIALPAIYSLLILDSNSSYYPLASPPAIVDGLLLIGFFVALMNVVVLVVYIIKRRPSVFRLCISLVVIVLSLLFMIAVFDWALEALRLVTTGKSGR